MKKKILLILYLIVFLILLFTIIKRNNSIEVLSKYGSQGEEVKQIQTKLKRWGYYNGNIDGIYGSKTLASIKLFHCCEGNCKE